MTSQSLVLEHLDVEAQGKLREEEEGQTEEGPKPAQHSRHMLQGDFAIKALFSKRKPLGNFLMQQDLRIGIIRERH